jgi:hypothetical protein
MCALVTCARYFCLLRSPLPLPPIRAPGSSFIYHMCVMPEAYRAAK